MGLTMSQRRAVTRTNATRYKRADKVTKGVILDELCATTGWHRNHARMALAVALRPRIVAPARKARAPRYDADTVVALGFCWAVLGAPTGKRLAPMMAELVPRLRRFDELIVTDEVATALVAMSPATMDRRLAPDRARLVGKGRSHTKPGSLPRRPTGGSATPTIRPPSCSPVLTADRHAVPSRGCPPSHSGSPRIPPGTATSPPVRNECGRWPTRCVRELPPSSSGPPPSPTT